MLLERHRICWFEYDGQRRVGVWEDTAIIDLSAQFPSLADFFEQGGQTSKLVESATRSGMRKLPLTTAVRVLPPVLPHNRVFMVAQNYPSHIQEAGGASAPSQPVIFLKPYSALVGHKQPIVLPTLSSFMDYEGELAVIIGRRGRNIPAAKAMGYVLGFTALNDVSARDLQTGDLAGRPIIDWFSAKSMDQTTPMGPCITLQDQVSHPHDLRLRLRLNGEVMQDERTGGMVFSIPELIEYISRRVRLEPGDVISTGTPAGVGRYRGISLKEGDVMEVEIEQVGVLSNPVASEAKRVVSQD